MKMIRLFFKWLFRILAFLIAVFFLFVLLPEKETVAPLEPRASTKYWEMKEGFKIAYTHVLGDSGRTNAKPPLVYLHGGPGGYVHSSIIETLGELSVFGYDVYLYDQRGSGLSDRLKKFSEVSFEKHLQDLHEIITTKISAQKVILIGQSFGSILIAHYASRYPNKVAKLVFSSPGALEPHRTANGKYLNMDSIYPKPDHMTLKKPYSFVKDVNKTAFRPKAIVASTGALLLDRKLVSDKQMDRMLNTLATKLVQGVVCDPKNALPEEGGGGLYAYLATNSGEVPDVRPTLRRLETPALILHGQCEFQPFSAIYEYVDLFQNSEYRFIEDAGHEIWWEQKEQYVQRIANFIGRE
ncbi:MAG: alpha/beta hydrolase [Bacteroidota bacterium]